MLTKLNLPLNKVELKFAAGDNPAGKFTGYASVFGGVDSYGDTILKGAYADVIARIKKGDARMPKMFVNHNSWELPVGKWTSMSEDSKGLLMEGELTPGNARAQEVKAAMQHETVDGLSIGFMVGEYKIVEDEAGRKRRIIEKIAELPETSIVTYPADDAARIDLTSVKSALEGVDSIRDFEEFLRDAGGFSRALAAATATRCKSIFAQRDSDVIQLPPEVAAQIARNLKDAQTL